MAIPDLWPEDINVDAEFVMPVTILREQASALTQRTKGILEAQVRSVNPEPGEDERFLHEFKIIAPALDGYTFELFYIIHRIEGYPTDIHFTDVDGRKHYEAHNQDQLLQTLKTIFSSQKAKNVIQALLAQSKS